jgi:hypothetical protein
MKISKIVLSTVLSATLFTQASWAQMASTEAVFEQPVAASSKQKVMEFAEREDVKTTLAEMGVEPQVLKERIASLTDEEAATMANRIDSMPAGGDAVGAIVGAAVFIFIVLLITDLLGFTKVFNFTRKITN